MFVNSELLLKQKHQLAHAIGLISQNKDVYDLCIGLNGLVHFLDTLTDNVDSDDCTDINVTLSRLDLDAIGLDSMNHVSYCGYLGVKPSENIFI